MNGLQRWKYDKYENCQCLLWTLAVLCCYKERLIGGVID